MVYYRRKKVDKVNFFRTICKNHTVYTKRLTVRINEIDKFKAK